jgi:predicted lipoprotein with Yx(FWY)xxD motif
MQRLVLIAALVATAGLVTACSSGGDSSVSSAPSRQHKAKPATTTTAAPTPTLQVASSSLGMILVDENGMTLYQLDTDTATMVTCTDQCARAWPPLTITATPIAGAGVNASLLSTVATPTGKQITYAGHPLYRFSGDQAAGQTNGFGTGGVWWVLAPDGSKIVPPAPPTTQMPAAAAPTSPPTEAPTAPPPPPSAPAPTMGGYGY